MKKKHLFWAIPLILILLFVITNPSPKAFKDYGGYAEYYQFKRTSNWAIFSIYEDIETNERYFGIFLNFYKIDK